MVANANPVPVQVSRSEVMRAIVAATIGNGIEWFDYISFAFFTPFIAKTFFPNTDPTLSLILTWASFGLSVVVRPFAGAILGVYGDRIGRRRVLAGIIIAMALGSLIVAVTPGYATIGIAAPILVLAARILQGISATGEYSSGVAFLVEYAGPKRKFLYGSFQFVSQQLATVLATLSAYAVTHWLKDVDWAWRLPFAVGIVVAPIGFYIRLRIAEAPEFAALRARRPQAPSESFGAFLSRNWMGVITTVGVTIPGTVMVYLWFLYGPSYAIAQLKLDADDVHLVTALCAAGTLIITPFAGWLADRTGPWRWFLPAIIVFGLGAIPMFQYMIAAPSIWRFLECLAVAMVLYGFSQGTISQLAASFFPTGMRSSGLGLSINLGVALFGGLAPFYVVQLIASTGDKMVPAYYILVATAVGVALMAVGSFGGAAQLAVRKQEEAA